MPSPLLQHPHLEAHHREVSLAFSVASDNNESQKCSANEAQTFFRGFDC